jgi:hypothetical protein
MGVSITAGFENDLAIVSLNETGLILIHMGGGNRHQGGKKNDENIDYNPRQIRAFHLRAMQHSYAVPSSVPPRTANIKNDRPTHLEPNTGPHYSYSKHDDRIQTDAHSCPATNISQQCSCTHL